MSEPIAGVSAGPRLDRLPMPAWHITVGFSLLAVIFTSGLTFLVVC